MIFGAISKIPKTKDDITFSINHKTLEIDFQDVLSQKNITPKIVIFQPNNIFN